MKNHIFLILVTLSFFLPLRAISETLIEENLSIDEIYQKGRLLRAQFKNKEARKYLKALVEKKSPKGLYLYAIELKGHSQTIRTDHDAYDYMCQAANLGDKNAMRYLALSEEDIDCFDRYFWKAKYLDYLNELATQEDKQGKVFFESYLFYKHSDAELAEEYLEQSVDLNYPIALMVQGDLYAQGGGSFWFESSRQSAVVKAYRKAAETNYLPAIKKYIGALDKTDDKDQAFAWLITAAESGDLQSVALAARVLSGASKRYIDDAPLNYPKAKAYYDIYLNVAGQEKFAVLYDAMLAEEYQLSQRMNKDQIDIAKQDYKEISEKVGDFFSSDLFWFDDGYLYSR